MYHEVWRIERDFLYDPNAHGLDLEAAEKLYAPFLDGIAGARRPQRALGRGARQPRARARLGARRGGARSRSRVNVGLLGADYTVEDGRYRFARILAGENWNPGLRAPLTAARASTSRRATSSSPSTARTSRATTRSTASSCGRAGKQTVITRRAEGRRQRVAQGRPSCPSASSRRCACGPGWRTAARRSTRCRDGRSATCYVPDTFAEGYANFNRYYFSQVGKEAVVIDERFNHGGDIADYIVNILEWTPHDGRDDARGPGHHAARAGGSSGPR